MNKFSKRCACLMLAGLAVIAVVVLANSLVNSSCTRQHIAVDKNDIVDFMPIGIVLNDVTSASMLSEFDNLLHGASFVFDVRCKSVKFTDDDDWDVLVDHEILQLHQMLTEFGCVAATGYTKLDQSCTLLICNSQRVIIFGSWSFGSENLLRLQKYVDKHGANSTSLGRMRSIFLKAR